MERKKVEDAIMEFAIACSELDMLQRELRAESRERILKSAKHLDKVNKFLSEVLKESK